MGSANPQERLMQTRNDAADYPLWQVDQAEKAIGAGNLEDAGLMMYNAIEPR